MILKLVLKLMLAREVKGNERDERVERTQQSNTFIELFNIQRVELLTQ